MTRDAVIRRIEEAVGIEEAAEIIMFDGMEDAFIGVAERFEPDGNHRAFAVYSYAGMVAVLTADGDLDRDDAHVYLEFNTVGLYAGPHTPAILRDES